MSPTNQPKREEPIASGGVIPASIRQAVSPELALQEYLEVINRRKWSIVTVFLIVVLVGMAYTLSRKRQYEASTKLVVVTRQGSEGASQAGGEAGSIEANLGQLIQGRNVGTQVEIVNSPDLLNEAFDHLTPEEKYKGFRGPILPVWAYSIENKPDTDVISITVTSYSPVISAELANAIAETYLKRDLQRNNEQTSEARMYVSKKLDESEHKLAVAEQKVADYKRKSGLISPTQPDLAEQYGFTLRNNLDDAQSQLASSVDRESTLGNQLKKIQPYIQSSQSVEQNPVFAIIQARISDLQGQRVDKLQEFRPASPEVQKIDLSIAAEKKRLADTVEHIVSDDITGENPVHDNVLTAYAEEIANKAALQVQYDVAKAKYDSIQPELEAYPAKEKGLEALTQEVDTLLHTYDLLSQRYYNLLINENSNLANGLIASYAHPPIIASYPKMVLSTLMIILLAILMSIGAAALVERFDSRIHDPMRIDQLTGLTTMTAVPEIESSSSSERPIIGAGHDSQAFLESYRILRNNIAFTSPDRECKTIAVTSAGQGEGKSTTAINLAISMGMDGKRALLVDVDLRRPSIHTALGLARDVGFTSVVTGKKTIEEAVQNTNYENVFCLSAGPLPPNPTEFLNSVQCREVLAKASALYDVVILDSPPTTGLSDVQVISTFVDGMLLVVGLEITRFPQLRATMQTLWQANAPMLGVVINRIAPNRPGYGYYYSYYTYYGADDSQGGKSAGKKRKKKGGGY